MSQELLGSINLKRRTLDWLGRRQYRGKSKGTFYPSEASVSFINEYGEREIVGKCHRACYYRLTGVEQTNHPTDQNQVLFMLGNSVEDTVTEAWKQMGIWENNSVKWEDKDRNISGEFDVVCREGDLMYGVEVKSFYGYFANKQILGHSTGRGANKRWVPGKPKDEHLMQTALYCAHSKGDLAGFKIFYVSRDGNDMAEFNVSVDDDGIIYVNGVANQRYTVNDIYTRYNLMKQYIETDTKPPREFDYLPSDERVAILAERGTVSATAFKDHQAGKKPVTDWHCSYCNYKDHCLRDDDEPEVVVAEDKPDVLVHGGL